MSGEELCGARTMAGSTCQWPRQDCPHRHHRQRTRRAPEPRTKPAQEPAEKKKPPVPEAILEERDLAALGWWLIRETLGSKLDKTDASTIVMAMRILASLDAPPEDTAALQQETELRARLMHGLPPRTEDEWALAARLFAEDTLDELRRWGTSGEVDGPDDGQPLPRRDIDAGQ